MTEAIKAKAKPVQKAAQELPTELLVQGLQKLAQALVERALSSMTDRIEGLTGRLTAFAEGGGTGLISAITGSDKLGVGKILGKSLLAGAGEAVKGAVQGLGKKGKKGGKLKVINIVESIDVGAPIRVVYNQWTQFQDFPGFMKKVENVEQESDEKLNWKAQIFWSHRSWEAHILEQVPDRLIIWRSKAAKGHVDGAVTFHELASDLTRVLVVLEYHPQGLFEHTGNMWRAQGRRARLELKHFRRHVMTQVLLHPEEMAEGGWRGEIHEGEVVKDHEAALEEERAEEEPADEERAEEEPEEAEEPEELEYEEEEEPAAEHEAEEEQERPRRRAEPARGRGVRRPVRLRSTEEEEAPSRPVRRRAGARRG
ncbi:SRPBCC family protein [Nonomuraea sp. NPDC000554]|uniref:SRPBCC family protein n=1 Tax=Nonomuraea sp. NPDC000554 TaxID=3154259 RepID=UPI00331F5F9A